MSSVILLLIELIEPRQSLCYLFYYIWWFWSKIDRSFIIGRWLNAFIICYGFFSQCVCIIINQLRTGYSFLTAQNDFNQLLLKIFILFALILYASSLKISCTMVHNNIKMDKIIKGCLWTLTASTWYYQMIKLILFIYNSIYLILYHVNIFLIFLFFVHCSLKYVIALKVLNVIASWISID